MSKRYDFEKPENEVHPIPFTREQVQALLAAAGVENKGNFPACAESMIFSSETQSPIIGTAVSAIEMTTIVQPIRTGESASSLPETQSAKTTVYDSCGDKPNTPYQSHAND